MRVGDLIIWDSNFGYELGIYVGGDGVLYNTTYVYMLTGNGSGNLSVNYNNVIVK